MHSAKICLEMPPNEIWLLTVRSEQVLCYITTADGLKLDNVPVIVQPGQAVELYGLL
jgi:hypothetical protein